MKRTFLRILSLLLIPGLLGGCATRTIHFSSNPEGALVSVGGASCTTPCDLKVPVETASACFTLPSGASREIPIGDLTGRSAATRYGLTRSGEYTLGSLAVPLLIGGGMLAFLACLFDPALDCFSDGGELAEPGKDGNNDLGWIALASMAAGWGLYFAGDRLGAEARELRPEVRASFVQTPLLPAQEPVPLLPRENDGTLRLFPDDRFRGN